MQNRELREAYARLQASRAEFAELYDRSPVGYATLDRKGVVLKINLTVASFLGLELDGPRRWMRHRAGFADLDTKERGRRASTRRRRR